MKYPFFFYLILLLVMGCQTENQKQQFQPLKPTDTSVGPFEGSINIGEPRLNGDVAFDVEKQKLFLSGSGENMWNNSDQFNFIYQSIQGDFIVRARMKFKGEGVDPHRKMGWIVRNDLSAGAAHVNATVHGDGLTSLQFRRATNALTEEIKSTDSLPDIVQLERRGDNFYMSTAKFGQPFTTVQTEGINLKNEVFVGLYICSHNPDIVENAVFSNIRIIKPVKKDFIPYTDYIGSNMEILDVETGHRTLLFNSKHSIQAPNWHFKSNSLLYNSNGLLYRYDLSEKMISQISTEFATNNNNDHVLSFDQNLLGISHHNPNDNDDSSIYTMSPEGDNVPVKITRDGVGASYLHGISPDNNTLLFTGFRNNKFDIYAIDRLSGEEIQLTNTPYLDDGSEYSPDGSHIYFNSNRTGSMKLWRMKVDGSDQEQLTFDDRFKDWFPHVSPDGKWIVFISFPPTVAFGDHPFYEHCTLRLMSAEGGEPKIIAYIYGGQGSINVPSWSSDSKRIAFVSNSN